MFTAAGRVSTKDKTELSVAMMRLQMHFDGGENSTTFTDLKGHGITVMGNAVQKTASAKWGASGLYLDGTGDYLKADAGDLVIGTQDFGLGAWVRLTNLAASRTIFGNRPTTASQSNAFSWYVHSNGGVGVWVLSGQNVVSTAGAISAGTWYYLELNRYLGRTRVFINGTDTGSYINDANDYNLSAISIGALGNGSDPFFGDIDDLRFSIGNPLHRGNFAVPTGPYNDY